MSSPSVHVVVLNWNGLVDTLECLASLRAQDYAPLRVHVVDNGSAEEEALTIEREYPEVSVLRQGRNLGFCGGSNVGIVRALGAGADFVMLLNNDTIVPPGCVRSLVDAAVSLDDLGAASPVILHYPEADRVWFAGASWEGETAGFRINLSGQPRGRLNEREPFESDYACGCCLLTPAAVLRRVGLLDERYFAYYEEADWASRLKAAGLRCYVVPAAALYHKVTRSTPGVVVAYMMARNRLLWMSEHLPWRKRAAPLAYLLRETLWNVCNVAAGIYHGRPPLAPAHSRAMLLALRDFLRGKTGAWPEPVERMEAGGK
jgi:GT2 family glycosyltransferase